VTTLLPDGAKPTIAVQSRKTSLSDAPASAQGENAQGTELRQRLGEFVGNVFYGTLIRQMQESKLKGPFLHGGRGEEVFQAQLGMELAKRLGRAPNDPVTNRLYEAMTKRGPQGKGAPEKGVREGILAPEILAPAAAIRAPAAPAIPAPALSATDAERLRYAQNDLTLSAELGGGQ
jgi:hypothetical protein